MGKMMGMEAKKTVLRMIPYGVFVLTSKSENGRFGTATVNWVTQASFEPPLVAVGVKVDSNIHSVIMGSKVFALNALGKGQQEIARKFFREVEVAGGKLSGEPYRDGKNGVPLLENALAYLECELVGTLTEGDHSVILGRVTDAGLREQPSGRPDAAILWLQDLGKDIFYGG